MRIRAPAKMPKVFRLYTPMHLLAKLHGEIAGFRRSLDSTSLHRHLLPAYHAFNCAVTAWHVSDWTWEYVGDHGQGELASHFGITRRDLFGFQDAVAASSRALNACREIATGSKHRDVKRKGADPSVQASAVWAQLEPPKSRPGPPRYGTVWLITDRNGTRPALDVFNEAAEYWHRLLAPWREDTLVTGWPVRRRSPLRR